MSKEKTDAQQPKKGLMRVIELLDRDSGKFFKSGALAFLGAMPYMAVLMFAVSYTSPLLLLACFPAGMLAAPQVCGCADTVMRSMRDEIGWWWWDTYKATWKRNARSVLLPGGAYGLLMGCQIYTLYLLASLTDPTKEFWMLFAALMVEFGILTYYLPMHVCMELPFPALVRNCFVLFFSHPIKSLWAALIQLIYYGFMLIWFPLTSVFLFMASVWMPMLLAFNVLYPALDQHFGLKEAYEKLEKARWEAEEE